FDHQLRRTAIEVVSWPIWNHTASSRRNRRRKAVRTALGRNETNVRDELSLAQHILAAGDVVVPRPRLWPPGYRPMKNRADVVERNSRRKAWPWLKNPFAETHAIYPGAEAPVH